MKKQALTGTAMALFVLALTVGMATTATAAESDDNETSDVNVTVASSTALDVKPDQLTYEDVSVGDRITETDNSHGFSTLKIENTGSEAISDIWMETTFPTENPFGQGNTNAHDSANFLQVKPSNTSDSTSVRGDSNVFHYVQRVEYFQNDYPLVETGTFGDGGTNDNLSVGRIRFGDNEFYFAMEYPSTTCDTGNIRVANTPTTPDSLGTSDFSDSGDDYTEYAISDTTGNGYGLVNTTVSLDLTSSVDSLDSDETQEYDILTKCDGLSNVDQSQPHIILSRYNIEAGGSSDLYANAGHITEQLFRSSGSEDLEPGDSIGADVAVQIPRGVPAGELTEGTLTVYSQAAN